MQNAIVIRGHLIGPRNVELTEAAPTANGEVEVIVRMEDSIAAKRGENIFEFLRNLPAGTRDRREIDEQLSNERAAWGDR